MSNIFAVSADQISDAQFRDSVEQYLGALEDSKVRSLADIVEFNKQFTDQELPPGMLMGFLQFLF